MTGPAIAMTILAISPLIIALGVLCRRHHLRVRDRQRNYSAIIPASMKRRELP